MHVNDVGANRHVHGDGDEEPRGCGENAAAYAPRLFFMEKRRHRLAETEIPAGTFDDRRIQKAAGFIGHAEAAGPQRFIDVL